MVERKKLLEYLKLISPSGFMANFTYLEWDFIERMYLHWLKTSENQFEEFIRIYSFLLQTVDFEKKKIRFRHEFIILIEPVIKGRYVFGIEDMFNEEECDTIKSIYNKITIPRKKNHRRICIVSQIKTVREAVFKRDGYKCKFCGSEKDLTVDHIIPVENGGKDEFSNFQTLCKSCNSSKSFKRQPGN